MPDIPTYPTIRSKVTSVAGSKTVRPNPTPYTRSRDSTGSSDPGSTTINAHHAPPKCSPALRTLKNVMKQRVIFGCPRGLAVLVVLALAASAVVGIRSLRDPVLRAAGWALVVSDPIAPADIIVISLDSDGAGVLEAADLVQSGISQRVAVFMDPPTGVDLEFIRRGLPYEDAEAREIRQLRSLGVTNIVQIARVNGTEREGQVLPPWCDEHHFRSIVVVATTDHSRRTRRVLDRAMKGHPTRVMVQPARYSSFDPDRWWETRGGIRTEIIELQKLLLDILLHPMLF